MKLLNKLISNTILYSVATFFAIRHRGDEEKMIDSTYQFLVDTGLIWSLLV